MARKKLNIPRGNKGNFRGSRLTFLEARIQKYILAVNSGLHKHFWNDLFADYWATFPWNLPLNVEPTEGMTPEEPKTEEEQKQKADILQRTTKVRLFFVPSPL